jgi:hypothetical protein
VAAVAPRWRGTLTILQPARYTGSENHLYRVEIHDHGEVSATGIKTIPLVADVAPGSTEVMVSGPLDEHVMNLLKWPGGVCLRGDSNAETVIVRSFHTERSITHVSLAEPVNGVYAKDKGAELSTQARFKWSRDNAAFGVGVTAVANDRSTLTLQTLGRDQATALRIGDLVEITDSVSDLGPGRGHLTRLVSDPDYDALTVTLADPLPPRLGSPPSGLQDAERHLTLRRWEGSGWANSQFDASTTPDMALGGDGVRIQFGGSDLRAGDYWQFAARTDGSIEALFEAPPKGIRRWRVPLAIVTWSIDEANKRVSTQVQDLTESFGPLAARGEAQVAVAPYESIEDAIDALGTTGGVLYLLPGEHRLDRFVSVRDKHRSA